MLDTMLPSTGNYRTSYASRWEKKRIAYTYMDVLTHDQLLLSGLIRHGIRQLRNPWADGPDRVTQCPIRPGRSYTYRFTIENQEGTLWWHAHSRWLRATVYGALIIHPKLGSPYPFPMPRTEIPILLGNPSFIFNPKSSNH